MVVGAALYLVLLTSYYVRVVAPAFEYAGYVYHRPPTYVPVVLAAVLAMLPACWLPIKLRRPSQAVVWFLYVLVFVPSCVIPFYSIDVNRWLLFSRACLLFLALVLLEAMYRLPKLRLPLPRAWPLAFWVSVGVISVAFYGYIVAAFGFDIRVLTLADVYLVRDEYKETIREAGRFVPYVVEWQANVINPLLIAQGLLGANPLLFGIGIAGQLFIFSITAYKSVLLSAVLVISLLVALEGGGKRFAAYVVWGSVVLIGVPWLIDHILGAPLVSFLLGRRLAVVPGLLMGYYMDFFSTHSQTFLGESIFRSMTDYPYTLSVPNLIGYNYLRNVDTGANASLWADGYANFGAAGVLGMTVVLGVFFWVFDGVAEYRDRRMGVLLLGVPAFTLANSGLLTTLLTHGMGFALLVFYAMPPPGASRSGEK